MIQDTLYRRNVQLLSQQEERTLLQAAQAGDITARNELVLKNVPFAVKIMNIHYQFRGNPYHVTRDDLMQACMLGLCRAIAKWDPAKTKFRFVTYAASWLRHFMDQAIHQGMLLRTPLHIMRKTGLYRDIHNAATLRLARIRDTRSMSPEDTAIVHEYQELLQQSAPTQAMLRLGWRKIAYDKNTGNWRCVLDNHTVLVAQRKCGLEEALDLVDQYVDKA